MTNTHNQRDSILVSMALDKALKEEASKPGARIWGPRHLAALEHGQDFERAILLILRGLALYADRHATRYEEPIGEYYVIGAAWSQSLQGVRALLNGETGRLECGSLDRAILAMAAAAGVEDFA